MKSHKQSMNSHNLASDNLSIAQSNQQSPSFGKLKQSQPLNLPPPLDTFYSFGLMDEKYQSSTYKSNAEHHKLLV